MSSAYQRGEMTVICPFTSQKPPVLELKSQWPKAIGNRSVDSLCSFDSKDSNTGALDVYGVYRQALGMHLIVGQLYP